MNQNIRKRMTAVFLTLTMLLGMLPAITFQASAAYPDPFTASVNTTTVLGTIADLSGVDLTDYINYDPYVFGFTQPVNGQGNYADLGLYNPGDLGYLPTGANVPSTIPNDPELDSICFRATVGGTYTFVLTVGGYSNTDGEYYLLSQRTITVEVSDPNAQPTPFYIGNAIHFNDGNDSLYVPSELTSATNNITMETWVKADTAASAGTYTRIMYNGNSGPNGYGIYLEGASKKVTILLGGVEFLYPVTPVYLSSGQWYHLAIVRDAGVWKLYVNGEEKPISKYWVAPNVPDGIFSVGNSPVPNENFIGCIDESRFWEVARSAQQIRDNMYLKLKATETGLLAYYNYDQTGVVPNGDNRSVTSVKNVKAAGANLTISGFALDGETSNFVPSVKLGSFQLGSTSYSVSKGQEKASVTITRTGGLEGTVAINYATANGTASAGSNYTSTSGILTFASGETTKTVDIPILANNTSGELAFTFAISAQQGVPLGSNTAATIRLAKRAGLNHLPVASGVQINGAMNVGNTVSGVYVYSDADGDAAGTPLYKWYRSDDQNGTGKTAIPGATSSTYQLQPVDLGKYINFEVTPSETDGTPGSAVESSRIVAVDATAPTVTEITGNPDSWTNSDVTLTVTASDSVSGLHTGGAYSFNGGGWTTSNSQTFTSNQTVNIRVRDNSNNIAEQNVVINKIDKAAPTGEITDGTNHWNSFLNAVTFGVFFKETASVSIFRNDTGGSGIKSVQYYKSDRELTLTETQALTEWSNYSSSLSLTPTDAEKFIIYAKITDNAGNVALISSGGMEFDIQGPSVSTNYTKDATSMEVSVGDSGSGIKNVTYKIGGGAPQSVVLSSGKFSISLPKGKYETVIFAEDTAGNTNSLTVNVVSLHTVTFKLFDGDTGTALKTETVEYGSAANAPANPTRAGFLFKNWDKTFSSITADTVVNATWDISGITVTPYIDIYDGAAHNAVTVSGTLPGDVITYSTNGTDYSASCPQYTNADSYPVYIKVERTGYTAWESGLKTAVISRAAGSITFTADPSKIYNGMPAPIPPVSKNGSGAVTYTYYNDNAGVLGAALPNTPVAAGIYWIKASMAQDTNFTAAETSLKFTISRADISGLVSIAIPALVKTGDTVSATLGGAFPGDMTIGYEWRLNGSAIPGQTGSSYSVKTSDYDKTLSVAMIGNGNYTGTNVSNTVTVTETVKPTGEISDGTNHWNSFLNAITFGLFFKETVSIAIDYSDDGGSGIKSVQYYKSADALTLAEVQALTEWSNYTSVLSLTPTDAEKFIIYAKITDNAGNVTVISSGRIEFDLQGPSISSNYTKDASSMEVTAIDSGCGIKAVTYTVNGGPAQTAVLTSDKFTISLTEGRYPVVVTAKDALGNENSLTVNVVSLHTVTFKLVDRDTGTALKTEIVEYGSAATAPANPTRTGFSFKNWDKAFSYITADTVVNATWDISGITITPCAETYDGTPHNAVSVSGTLPGDVITYSTNGTDYSASCPQYTNAEGYPVYVKVARIGYTAWESGLKTAVISRAAGSITFTTDPSKIYNGQPAPIPPVSRNGSGAVTYTYYNDNAGVVGEALPNAPVAAGIYWIKASMAQDTNYTAAETSFKFTISRADIIGLASIPVTVMTGDTVNADVSGVLPDGVTFDYQWKLNGAAIDGATENSYKVKTGDYGKSLAVTLIAKGDYANSITSSSVTIGENIAPTGTITQGTNHWNNFLNTITFGLFFKETATISMSGEDAGGSGVKSIQYYKASSKLSEKDVLALTEWSNYSSELSLTPSNAEKFIIYAKITDNAGNVTVISSDGMEFDLQGPTIVSDYVNDADLMEVSVTDSGAGVKDVTYKINGGVAQTTTLSGGKFTISSLVEGRYDVVVTAKDNLGNESSLTVQVVSLFTVTFKMYSGDTGTALKTEIVEFGSTATAPADPTRVGFSFKSWDKAFSNITADTVVNATWDISGITVTSYIDTYDGAAHNAVSVSGTLPGDVITYSTNGTDYSTSCPQYTNAGSCPVYVKAERSGYTAWSTVNTAVILTKDITADMITNIPSSEYAGQPVTPLPEVKFGSIVLIKDADYTVIYSDHTGIGIASVSISGKGNYSGSVTKKFAIYAKNTGVEIKDKETPPVMAKGLESLYEDESVYTEKDRQIEQNGGTVKIELSVQVKSDLTDDKKKIEEIASDKSIDLYLDLSLYKTVTMTGENNGTTTRISRLNDLLTIEIPIPENIKGKNGIALYRVHDGAASMIPVGKENAAEGEYCVINAETITLYVRNFSTYAIGFDKVVDDVKKPDTGDHTTALPIVAFAISLTAVMALPLGRRRIIES